MTIKITKSTMKDLIQLIKFLMFCEACPTVDIPSGLVYLLRRENLGYVSGLVYFTKKGYKLNRKWGYHFYLKYNVRFVNVDIENFPDEI